MINIKELKKSKEYTKVINEISKELVKLDKRKFEKFKNSNIKNIKV